MLYDIIYVSQLHAVDAMKDVAMKVVNKTKQSSIKTLLEQTFLFLYLYCQQIIYVLEVELLCQ